MGNWTRLAGSHFLYFLTQSPISRNNNPHQTDDGIDTVSSEPDRSDGSILQQRRCQTHRNVELN